LEKTNMKLTRVIDSSDGTRCLRVVVTQDDGGAVAMRVQRVAPRPEVAGCDMLFSDIRQPADADRVALQIHGRRARGDVDAVEATQLVETVNTIRSAMYAMRHADSKRIAA
jgi:hypothetical protein